MCFSGREARKEVQTKLLYGVSVVLSISYKVGDVRTKQFI